MNVLEQRIDSRRAITPSLLLLLFLNLSYFKFFRPKGVNDDLLKAVYYAVLFFCIFISFKKFVVLGDSLSKLIRWLVLLMIASLIPAMLFWGQSPADTFISTIPYFSFLIYFLLQKLKPDPIVLEKLLFTFLIVFLACFYLALVVAPIKIFEGYGELDKELDTERGMSRIRLTLIGAGPLFLGYFWAIAKCKERKGVKWLLIVLFLFITIVLQLSRQAIIYCLVLGLWYVFDNLSVVKRLVLLSVMVIASWVLFSDVGVISALTEKSQSEYGYQNSGDENVRIGAYRFYFSEVSPNLLTYIFGNGMYSLGKSAYGDYVDKNGRAVGYIPADVGYASIYMYYGIIGLAIFIFILVYVARLKVAKEYRFAKYYVYFLYLGNIAGSTLLGSIPLLCIAFYLLQRSSIEIKTEIPESASS